MNPQSQHVELLSQRVELVSQHVDLLSQHVDLISQHVELLSLLSHFDLISQHADFTSSHFPEILSFGSLKLGYREHVLHVQYFIPCRSEIHSKWLYLALWQTLSGINVLDYIT